MKKIQAISLILTAASLLAFTTPALAGDLGNLFSAQAKDKEKPEKQKDNMKKEDRKDNQSEVNPNSHINNNAEAEIKVNGEVKGEKVASPPGLLKKLFNNIAISSGQVTAISGTTLIVVKDSKTYTVETDGSTKFRRKFWGQSSISEISVNDLVNVIGKWTDEKHTQITAQFVRDISIQKRFGVFFSKVTVVSGNELTVETGAQGTLIVTTAVNTQFVNRRQETISLNNIVVGHRIRVRGLWDVQNHTLTEVTHVKDFSLPPLPSPINSSGATPAL